MNINIKQICVFCGASRGKNPIYTEITQKLAKKFLDEQIALTYGGGKVGLMGEIADSILAGGGKVIGVIPRFLQDKEIGHTGVTELHIVESMSERKNLLSTISDGFILLPGGVGSLDEFFEVVTASQLGQHNKPIAILNINHYYDDLIKFLNHSTLEGFWFDVNRNKLIIGDNPDDVVNAMLKYHAPISTRWAKATEDLTSSPAH